MSEENVINTGADKLKEHAVDYTPTFKSPNGDSLEVKPTIFTEFENSKIPAFHDAPEGSWLKSAEARLILKCSRRTLQRKVKNGEIGVKKIRNNLSVYNPDDIYRLAGVQVHKRKIVGIYARVESKGDDDELKQQIDRMTDFAARNGLAVEKVYSDIGRSMDFKKAERPGLNKMLLDIVTREVTVIVVESPDRIARFGYELLLEICKLYKIKIIFASYNPYRAKYRDEVARELMDIAKYIKKIYDEPTPKTQA